MSATRQPLWITNRLVNRVFAPLLRGPLGRRLGHHFAVIHYRGRRTGTAYELVTQYARDGATVWIMPGNPQHKTWWRNMRGPMSIELWLAGQEVAGEARAIEGVNDPAAVREGLAVYLGKLPRVRKQLNLSAPSGDADPALDQLSTSAVVVRVDLRT
jgi:hypothetical protein